MDAITKAGETATIRYDAEDCFSVRPPFHDLPTFAKAVQRDLSTRQALMAHRSGSYPLAV
jgi:hypothetical protein